MILEDITTRGNGKGLVRTSAVVGMTGVILGAFGAHGLEDLLAANDRADVWHTAVFYHLVHAVVLLVVATAWPDRRLPWVCFFLGILIFSGTLYLLALTNRGFLGAVTPVGGVFLIAGWLALAIRPERGR